MTALEILKSKGVSEDVYGELSQKQINAMAKALDPTFRVPASDAVKAELVAYTPKAPRGKPGMFVSVNTGGRGGIFHRVNDGEKITDEGKVEAKAILSALGNACADLLDTL